MGRLSVRRPQALCTQEIISAIWAPSIMQSKSIGATVELKTGALVVGIDWITWELFFFLGVVLHPELGLYSEPDGAVHRS